MRQWRTASEAPEGQLGRELFCATGHAWGVTGVSFATLADGRRCLVSSGEDGGLRCYDSEGGALLWAKERAFDLAVRGVCAADGRIFAVGNVEGVREDGEPPSVSCVKVFDLESGDVVHDMGARHGTTGSAVAVYRSAPGRPPCFAASAARGEARNLFLYDLGTMELKAELEGHGDSPMGVLALCFVPGEGLLASGGADGHVKIWDVHSACCLQTIATAIGGKRITAMAAGHTEDEDGGRSAKLYMGGAEYDAKCIAIRVWKLKRGGGAAR